MILPGSRYGTHTRKDAFVRELLERVRGLPEVEAAAISDALPFVGYSATVSIAVEGQPAPPPGERPSAPVLTVTPQYLRTTGTRLLSGRTFDERDTETAPRIALVNSSFAQRFFPEGNPLGKRFRYGGPDTEWTTVVGVVADVRHRGREFEAEPLLMVPWPQHSGRLVNVLARTRGDAAALGASLRSEVWAIDGELPVFDIATLEERLSRSSVGRETRTWLLTGFAILAMGLSALGIYGVVAEAVSRRTREIGLRVALGAQRGDVLRSIMKRSVTLTFAGLGIGGLAAFYPLRYLTELLYGVGPTDGVTFAGATAVLLVAAVVAAYLPARRAARIDPSVALRCE
jgi:putative ABC transport system permease protein